MLADTINRPIMNHSWRNRLAYQREYRLKTGNRSTNKYEKTPNGHLMRTYRNMLSRVTGVQKKKAHIYKGLPILDREEFYDWALSGDEYINMWKVWALSDYDRKLTPSIDRIDSRYGYELWNMQWLTHSDNSAKTTRKIPKGGKWKNYKKN